MERSDLPLKHDKTIIEVSENKKQFKPNKPGTINYSIEDEKLYVTVKSKGPRTQRPQQTEHDALYQGKYDRILTTDDMGTLEADINLKGGLTVRDNLNIINKVFNKEIETLEIERPMIELNANEKDAGNTLKRAGVNINRGTKGSANMFFDETLNAFNFCLNEAGDDSIHSSETKIYTYKANRLKDDNRKFEIPFEVEENEILVLFLNSIKVLKEEDYIIEDGHIITRQNVDPKTEITILRFGLHQKDKEGNDIQMPTTRLSKTTRIVDIDEETNIISLNEYHKDSPYYDGFSYNIKKDLLLVFVNGTFFGNNLYSTHYEKNQTYIKLDAKIKEGSEVYIVSISPLTEEKQSRIYIETDYQNIKTKKGIKEYELEDRIKSELEEIANNEETISKVEYMVFSNSVLLDTDIYEVKDGKLILTKELNEDTEIEIILITTTTLSPSLDALAYLMDKDDFNILATINEKGTVEANKFEGEELDIKSNGHIQNLLVTQRAGTEYGLEVQGDQRVKNKLEVDGLTSFNDEVDMHKKIRTHDIVNHYDYVKHGKNYLYLNDLLLEDDGGIVFERSYPPHAVIKWNEQLRRWMAGIEGSEQVIITKDMLYSIIEKLIDLSGLDEEILNSVIVEQASPIVIRSEGASVVTPNFNRLIDTPLIKENSYNSLLVFVNGRFVSNEEYTIDGNKIVFNGKLKQGTIVYPVRLKLKQESLTGYSLRKSDIVNLEKDVYTIHAEHEGQRDFLMPYNIEEYQNACLIYINGILLTKDLYNISGSMLSLNFDSKLPTEINLVRYTSTKAESLSRTHLITRHATMKLDPSQKDVVRYRMPKMIRGNKQNTMLFCNTTFIHKDDYYIDGDYLILDSTEHDGKKTVTNPPTELTMVEIMPIIKSTGGCCKGGSNTDTNSRNYSTVVEANAKYVVLPFDIDKANPSTMVFLDGKILNKSEYDIEGRILRLINRPIKESNLYVMDLVNSWESPDDISGKGAQTYEFESIGETQLPFTVNNRDSIMVFEDGILSSPDRYTILGDKFIPEKINDGTFVKIVYLTDIKNITYDEKIQDQRVIVKQDKKDDIWVIDHKMNTYPNVVVIDEDNQVINEVRVRYDSANMITLKFNKDISGKVILS